MDQMRKRNYCLLSKHHLQHSFVHDLVLIVYVHVNTVWVRYWWHYHQIPSQNLECCLWVVLPRSRIVYVQFCVLSDAFVSFKRTKKTILWWCETLAWLKITLNQTGIEPVQSPVSNNSPAIFSQTELSICGCKCLKLCSNSLQIECYVYQNILTLSFFILSIIGPRSSKSTRPELLSSSPSPADSSLVLSYRTLTKETRKHGSPSN